jgi:hypothetical protein
MWSCIYLQAIIPRLQHTVGNNRTNMRLVNRSPKSTCYNERTSHFQSLYAKEYKIQDSRYSGIHTSSSVERNCEIYLCGGDEIFRFEKFFRNYSPKWFAVEMLPIGHNHSKYQVDCFLTVFLRGIEPGGIESHSGRHNTFLQHFEIPGTE